jgi:hypothetical protein
MQSTCALLDAAVEALEQEANETDRTRRAVLLARTRATLAQWRTGVLTTEQAVADLHACRSAERNGVSSRA